jgi:hypothetical protein
MTAMTGEAATAASTSAFNGGNGTVMAASAAETTLKVRAEVSAWGRADSGGCSKGGGASGSEGKGKGAADSDSCRESCGDGCGEGSPFNLDNIHTLIHNIGKNFFERTNKDLNRKK